MPLASLHSPNLALAHRRQANLGDILHIWHTVPGTIAIVKRIHSRSFEKANLSWSNGSRKIGGSLSFGLRLTKLNCQTKKIRRCPPNRVSQKEFPFCALFCNNFPVHLVLSRLALCVTQISYHDELILIRGRCHKISHRLFTIIFGENRFLYSFWVCMIQRHQVFYFSFKTIYSV